VNEVVLDASALLALLNQEPGGNSVGAVLPRAAISSVNVAEVVSKLVEQRIPDADIRETIQSLGLKVVDFDVELAYAAGLLHLITKKWGLSLGDRACLALAHRLHAPAFTTDRAWKKIKIGLEVRAIR